MASLFEWERYWLSPKGRLTRLKPEQDHSDPDTMPDVTESDWRRWGVEDDAVRAVQPLTMPGPPFFTTLRRGWVRLNIIRREPTLLAAHGAPAGILQNVAAVVSLMRKSRASKLMVEVAPWDRRIPWNIPPETFEYDALDWRTPERLAGDLRALSSKWGP